MLDHPRVKFTISCLASAASAVHSAIGIALLLNGNDHCVIWFACAGMYAFVAYSNLVGSWIKKSS